MGNSARVARERLRRITPREWTYRVNLYLSIAGCGVGAFRSGSLDQYYNAGLNPGETVERLLRERTEARNENRN